MLHRFRSAAAAAIVAIVAACSVPSGSDGPIALATPSVEPTRTAAPTAGPTPTATTSPRSTPSPAGPATPGPSPYDPELEAMLPQSLRGIAISTFSSPMAPFAMGGDMCLLLCPSEPGRLAKASGVPIERMSFAIAVAPDGSDVAAGVMAIRFRGVDGRSLVDVRLNAGSHSTPTTGLPAKAIHAKVGERDVVWATWPPFYEDRDGEYLLERGDVLFIVEGLPPSAAGMVPDDVALLIEALP